MSVRSETVQYRELPHSLIYHIDYVNYLKWASSIRLLWLYKCTFWISPPYFLYSFNSFLHSAEALLPLESLLLYLFVLWLIALFEYSFNGTNNLSLELPDFLLCVIALRDRNSVLDLIIKMSMTHWTQIVVLYSFFQRMEKKNLTFEHFPPLNFPPCFVGKLLLLYEVTSRTHWKWKWSHSVVSDSLWPHGL